MQDDRFVITGIGVVAPNGIGKKEFWKNCRAGVSGIKPITLFDTSGYHCHQAGEISDFQPEKYLGIKGLRNLDRTTLLALVAAKLAVDDTKLQITKENAHHVGVVLGSTMGSVHSISSFDIESLREGPRFVNPARFPNTVINSPASQISIRFGIKGLNATIGAGFISSFSALEYGLDMLRTNRVKVVLVGAVEELCSETFSGFYRLNLLELANGHASHKRTIAPPGYQKCFLGEGSGMLVLESQEHALARGAFIYGEVLSVTSQFDSQKELEFCISETSMVAVVREALSSAGILPDQLNFVCSDEHFRREKHKQSDALVREIYNGDYNLPRIISIQSLVGECLSASGILQLIACVGLTQHEGQGVGLLCSADATGACAAATVKLDELGRVN